MDPFTNCIRHEAYATREDAEAALRRWKARARAQGKRIVGNPVAHKCKVAGHWHIGRKGGRRG